jgi:hypothetical protein
MATATKTAEEVIEDIRENIISKIESDALERSTEYRLSDAIREGSSCTTQEYNWGTGDTACALSAGGLALKARGYI